MDRIGAWTTFCVGAAVGVVVLASASQVQWYWIERKRRKATLQAAHRLTDSIQAMVETERRANTLNDSFLQMTSDLELQHTLSATPSRPHIQMEDNFDETITMGNQRTDDNQGLLNLLFNIAESQAKKGL
ncbi:uncharacterized protein LOC144435513 [Glandiceps talaboti]